MATKTSATLRSSASCPLVDVQPDAQGPQVRPPSWCSRSLTRSFWVVTTRHSGGLLPRPAAQILDVVPRVGVMVREGPEGAHATRRGLRSVRRKASGLPMPQNAATGRSAQARSSGAVARRALTRLSGRCVVSTTAFRQRSVATRVRSVRPYSAARTWSQRVSTTTPARRRLAGGSRSRPRGNR